MPAEADVSTNDAPIAKIALVTNRQRNDATRPLAAESMVGSLNFSTQLYPQGKTTMHLLAFGLTEGLYAALQRLKRLKD